MSIRRVEVAVECDDFEEDGMPAVAVITEALGLGDQDFIDISRASSEDGSLVVIATMEANPGAHRE